MTVKDIPASYPDDDILSGIIKENVKVGPLLDNSSILTLLFTYKDKR